jgi:anti-anti-sigma factor
MPDDRTGFAAEVVRLDGHAVVVVRGDIDMATADQFRTALGTAMAISARVEIDLRETTFMDSSGLAVLVSAHRGLDHARDAIILRDPTPMIRRVLEVSGIRALVGVQPDGDGARRNGDRH